MKKQSGKGDKPRNCFSEQFRSNYDGVKWEKSKINAADQMNVEKYPEQVHEIVCCLLDEEDSEYFVTDESTISHFMPESKDMKRLKVLQEKYNVGRIKKTDLIWVIAEKMYQSKKV